MNMEDGMTPPGDEEPLAPDDIRDEERAEDEPSKDSAMATGDDEPLAPDDIKNEKFAEDEPSKNSELATKLGTMNKLLDRLSKRIQKVKTASTEKDDNTDRLEEKNIEMEHWFKMGIQK